MSGRIPPKTFYNLSRVLSVGPKPLLRVALILGILPLDVDSGATQKLQNLLLQLKLSWNIFQIIYTRRF